MTTIPNLLTREQAKEAAELNWGTGGTNETTTNTEGAYYFSCASHGGWVIDSRLFTARARKTCRLISFNSPLRRNNVPVYLFEEDCDWCIPIIVSDMRLNTRTGVEVLETQAKEAFERNFRKTLNDLDYSEVEVAA